ncbi:MAG: hypothetical protein HEQ39_07695 [Rhizobacter sp.]
MTVPHLRVASCPEQVHPSSVLMHGQTVDLAFRNALNNSCEAVMARIWVGYKAFFAANGLACWQEKQRRRPPESVLPQSAMGCAEHPHYTGYRFSAGVLEPRQKSVLARKTWQ